MTPSTNFKDYPSRERVDYWRQNRRLRGMGMFLLILLSAVPVFAQGKTEINDDKNPAVTSAERAINSPSTQRVTRSNADIPPDAAVLTFVGPCEHATKASEAKGCKTVMTRAEMDSLLNTLEPNALPAARRQFAINYSRLLAASGAAQRRHLEKDPAVVKQIQLQEKLARMQVLANALYSQIEAQANDVPASEVEKFYAEHPTSFVHGDVRRLTIPKSLSATAGQSADTPALQTLAEELRMRAAAGEDFDQLQQEVYKNLAIKLAIPATKLTMARPTNLPVAERAVFDLEIGQVTPVVDSSGTFTILKLESKQAITLENAKSEILPLLQRERAQQEIRKVAASGNAEFNLKYLGLPTAPEFLPPPQIAGLAVEQGTQSNVAQRMPLRRPMLPHRREVPAAPPMQR